MGSNQARLETDADRADARAPQSPVAGFPGRDDFDRDVWCVLGLPIDRIDLAGAAAAVEEAVRLPRPLNIATPNVNWLVRALKDRQARRLVLDADLSLVDGAPLVAAARLLGARLMGRVAGSDLFEALRARPRPPGRRLRVFFLGGEAGTAERAAKALADEGGLEPAGYLNPGFGDVESMSGEDVIARINAASPDFVVVSLGAAKGQAWIARNKDRLTAPVASALGAVVNFAAGTVRRAPRWVSRIGFEWVWRIGAEPALWRRYAADGAALAAIAATRLVPQLLWARPRRRGAPASATLENGPGGVIIRLAGDLVAGDLAPVRTAFRAGADADGDVSLDFTRAAGMDPAFLGQVLMLEKRLIRRGAALRVFGLSPAGRALFRANAMDYPLADEKPSAARQDVTNCGRAEKMRGQQ